MVIQIQETAFLITIIFWIVIMISEAAEKTSDTYKLIIMSILVSSIVTVVVTTFIRIWS